MLDYKPLFDVGEGEPIILLNGLIGNLSNWGRVTYELAASHRVLIPRMPFYQVPISTARLNDLVSYLEEFIEAHGLDKVILIGNSLGGHMALLFAWRQPAKVRKLVLASSSGIFENAAMETVLSDALDIPHDTQCSILHHIYAPTLLIWGLKDTLTPPEVALAFHEHLPQSKIIFLDQCGHMPMMEQPKLFNYHVREFLER